MLVGFFGFFWYVVVSSEHLSYCWEAGRKHRVCVAIDVPTPYRLGWKRPLNHPGLQCELPLCWHSSASSVLVPMAVLPAWLLRNAFLACGSVCSSRLSSVEPEARDRELLTLCITRGTGTCGASQGTLRHSRSRGLSWKIPDIPVPRLRI